MNKSILGLFVFSVVAILGISMIAASPMGQGQCMGGGIGDLDEDAKAFHESLQNAIVEGDFAMWKSLMESQITEERFEKVVERYNSMEEQKNLREEMQQAWDDEDYTKVKELREQIQENMPERSECEGDDCSMKREGRQPFFERFMFWKN